MDELRQELGLEEETEFVAQTGGKFTPKAKGNMENSTGVVTGLNIRNLPADMDEEGCTTILEEMYGASLGGKLKTNGKGGAMIRGLSSEASEKISIALNKKEVSGKKLNIFTHMKFPNSGENDDESGNSDEGESSDTNDEQELFE